MKILSPTELKLLALVVNFEGQTGRRIASEYLRLTSEKVPFGTLYTTFRRMEEAGLLVKRTDDVLEDDRLRVYESTQKGKRSLDLSRDFYKSLAKFLL